MFVLDKLNPIKPDMGMLYSLQGLWQQHPWYQGGVVGHWIMNAGAGSFIYDVSGNELIGTLVNAPPWAIGRAGWTIHFSDGTSHHADLGNISSTIFSGDFTISALINATGTLGATNIILDKRAAAGDGFGFHVDVDTDIKVLLDGTTLQARVASLSGWTRVGATRIAGDVRIYRNGLLVGGPTANANDASTTNVAKLSTRSFSSIQNFFPGMIDDVFISARGFTDAEMQEFDADPYLPFRWASEQIVRTYFIPPSGGVASAANYYYRMVG